MGAAVGDYDVIVAGGGINGAGIARDAATRGLRVLLLEKDDFGSGTSSGSSRLIHGGLRYLEHGEFGLVFESLRERERLAFAAPHLVRPLAINIPVYDDARRGPCLLRAGMLLYDLLSVGKSLPRHRMLGRDELLREVPALNPRGLRGGARYFDAQVSYAERLVIENVVAAAESGAEVRNYCPLVGIDVQDKQVVGVRFRDRESGREEAATAEVVINAAGPWVDRVLARATVPFPRLLGGTKGSHIVVDAFAGAPSEAFYVEARADGRPFFIIPWLGQYLIGTTDIRYDGDPADARPDEAEAKYLLEETNRVFPEARLGPSDIRYAYAGIRPLPFRSAGPEASITRRHVIRTHEDRARGLVSVIGGKLTTYRSLAEDVVDRVIRMSGRQAGPCRTRELPLPGARRLAAAEAALREGGVPAAQSARLVSVYGGRALEVMELAGADTGAGGLLSAEVAFAVRKEYARSLVDILFRRSMLGLDADLGQAFSRSIARQAAVELAWSEAARLREEKALERHRLRLSAPFGGAARTARGAR